ncbi:hypothetical protein OESDEN_16163 [Oesophagostomum dentatum]|uniref:MULE transposase domain-containing protein n=1 Tax=Oesophagostomum dentatum TaxID=61180 RepID=A0A0B1SKX1_OESDE|nr:hypothetical protein OESDEN_16163 [Oesophagostomum dentatum]
MNVHSREDGKLDVKGCFGHVGHAVEPALLRLNKNQEELLKSLLEGKAKITRAIVLVITAVIEHSMDYIIRKLKRDYSAKDSRLWFVEGKDLWTLANRFGLRPGYRDKSDMKSLMICYGEKNADDGIRHLQISDDPNGKGFCLISIVITPTQLEWLKRYSSRGIAVDGTHNVTRYNLKLATVSVADHKDRGLPAAFMLSGTMTTSDAQKLLTEVKNVYPDFNPSHIVTDEAPCFYNGFRAVFPSATAKQHYCRCHIDQTFMRATTKLVEII